MKMRTALPVCCLLLSACGRHDDPSAIAGPPDPIPMCSAAPPPAGVTAVRLVVFADGATKPAQCTVRSGMEVLWETQVGADVPFLLRFKQPPGTAAPGWAPGEPGRFRIDDPQKQFPSRRDGDRQQVRLVTKVVTVPEDIGYCVAMEVSCPDPGIKILPN